MYRLVKQGEGICFEDIGKGSPPLVFLHDIGCDHSSFSPQVDYFRRGHRVVSVDLLGHGQSDKPDKRYCVELFAEDVAWLIYELGLYSPVIVGHGLGGMIALELAVGWPDVVAGVVAIGSLFAPPAESISFLKSICDYVEHLPEKASSAAIRVAVERLFSAGADRRNRERVLASLDLASRKAISSSWQSVLSWEGSPAISGCTVPALYLDAGLGAADLASLRKLNPLLVTDTGPDVGHFLQLENPDRVNGAVDRFLLQTAVRRESWSQMSHSPSQPRHYRESY